MALGLVGGALHAPFFSTAPQAPGAVQAVISSPVASLARDGRPTSALLRRAATGPAANSVQTDSQEAPQRSLAETLPTSSACVKAQDKNLAGGDDCLGGGKDTRLWVTQELPDNPTGVRYVGAESNRLDCTPIPTNPLVSCTPGSPSGDK